MTRVGVTELTIDGRTLVGVPRAEFRRLTEGASATSERLRGQLESARKAHADAMALKIELKSSLDDALSQIIRLSDEREELKAKLEAHTTWGARGRFGDRVEAPAERMVVRHPPLQVQGRRTADGVPGSEPISALRDLGRGHGFQVRTDTEELAASTPAGSRVEELHATIVSQAREIARLKGESA